MHIATKWTSGFYILENCIISLADRAVNGVSDQLHILAVVGDPLAERLLSRYLRGQGFQVTVVATEEELFDNLQYVPIDLILFDADTIKFSVTSIIKLITFSEHNQSNFFILILSSDVFRYMDDDNIFPFVDAFIYKPVAAHTLVDTINTLGIKIKNTRFSKK